MSEATAQFFHPETGEPMSKNAYKKLLKEGSAPKKEKKEKVAPVSNEAKKEKKEKKGKEPEEIFTDTTPIGDYKRIEDAFPPTYQPKYVEAAWQTWWEKEGFYQPDVAAALEGGEEGRFVMVIPPPNVTGSLHLGHALTNAIEDTITRWNRMKGKATLWVPGTDHAGIATQSVVEKRLKKEEGVSRHDLGREAFTKRVWEWKETYGGKITNQIRMLGASVDWTREAFTMDANLSKAVTEAFVRFHDDGLLYRDTRLINWSCALQSAISEIEVDYIDLEGKTFLPVPNHTAKEKYEFGMITSFAYRILESETPDEEIVIATTRLETMLGDSAIAVHPEDPRYTHLHGKFVAHPFLPDRKIPIILDDVLVDMSFGTGAVKVTPAHDPNDYLCGKRHGLDFIVVLTDDGRIAANGAEFAGMMRYDARIAMETKLKEMGLFRGKEVNKMRLGLCSRSGDIIEPMLTPQWYVNCNSMAARAVAAVREGQMKIVPEIHEATWYRWLENIRDWCVSRQLWWGHRIPAYFVRLPPAGENPDTVDKNDPANSHRWIVARSVDEARTKAAEKLREEFASKGGEIASLEWTESDVSLTQDEDVLDTWFSSGLFPFSVFGWPDKSEELQAFYPTSLLETGSDILFFWVARMVMMGLHLTDSLPFKTVYLHAMVRDKNGRKMSKSLGNVIDPLEVINGCALDDLLLKIDQGNLAAKEVVKAKTAQKSDFPDGIPECGADALRFGLLAYTVQGRDVNLDIKRVVGYRQFCNKIWNAFRFAFAYVSDFKPSKDMHLRLASTPGISVRDLFVLSKLNGAIKESNLSIEGYLFGATTSALHSFFLYDVCDFYLEVLKPVFSDTSDENKPAREAAQATLYTTLEQFLRLAHPLMPFVTEELWQRLANRHLLTDVKSIMIARYPEPVEDWFRPDIEADVATVQEAIHGARSLRSDYRVANHVKADFYFRSDSPTIRKALLAQKGDFCTLGRGNFLKLFVDESELASSGGSLPDVGAEAQDVVSAVPKACCVKVVSDQLSVLVDLTGILDIGTEIDRLKKEVDRLTPMIDSYKRKMEVEGYESKVPQAVQQVNSEKLAAYEGEMATTLATLAAFEAMS